MSEQEERRITKDNNRIVTVWLSYFMKSEVGEVDVQVLKSALVEVGVNDKRVRIKVPTAEKPIRPSSYPPGFPLDAWRYIKSWKVASSEN